MLKCKMCDRPIILQIHTEDNGNQKWIAWCVNNCPNNFEDYKEEYQQILGLQKIVGKIEIN